MPTQQQWVKLPTSGLPKQFPNSVGGASSLQMTYKVNNFPTALTLILMGMTPGAGAQILDVYTGLVGTVRTVALTALYDHFTVVPVWTNGVGVTAVDATILITGPGSAYKNITSGGGFAQTALSASGQVPAMTDLVLATGGAAGMTLTLNPASVAARPVTVLKVDQGAGAVSVVGLNGTPIDGVVAGYNLVNQWQNARFGSDGTNLYVMGNN